VPFEIPVTIPPELTEAWGAPPDHTPPDEIPVNVIVEPTQTVVGPVMVAVGAAFTVTA
jgi:hypothetical protein